MNYQKKFNQKYFKTIYFLIVYLMYLGCITLSPFEFSLLEYKKYFSYSFSKIISLLFQLHVLDFFLNIILFIPFGIIIYFLFKKYLRYRKTDFFIPLIAGMLLSSSIEFIQIFTDRFTSFWDMISNILGCVIGFTAMKNGFIRNTITKGGFKIWRKPIISFTLLIIYIFFLFILLYYPYHTNRLRNWDDSYPLILGNEATLNRPWKGEIFTVALYNKRLSADKADELFKRGCKDTSLLAREESGLILLYDFREGSGKIIHDLVYELDLKAENVQWLDHHGISIDSTSRLNSINSTEHIIDLLKSTSELSIEVWCRTLDLHQTGPARIISLSITPEKRNFTLGQNGKDIHLRVRTPLTGLNGSKINLVSSSVLRDKDLHHIVAVFDHGTERAFLDGKPAPDMIRADINYFSCIFELGTSYFSRICFYFLFFFPLGFLISQVFSKSNVSLIIIIVVLIVSLEQYFYQIFTGQSFGIELFFYGILFSIIGGLSVRSCFFSSVIKN
ncbi:MAG: VanZ family protein [bacterium]